MSNDSTVMVLMSGGMGSVAMLSVALGALLVLGKRKATPAPVIGTTTATAATQPGKSAKMPSTTYNGPYPKAAWKTYNNLLIMGHVVKTMPYAIDTCKKECHKDRTCTHIEGNVDANGQKVCVLKSMAIPSECAYMKERCSDGFSSTVDFLYAHPERVVATKNYAQNIWDASKAKICDWKCRFKKVILTIITVYVTIVTTLASIVTFQFEALPAIIAFDVAMAGIATGVQTGVDAALAKDQKNRSDAIAKGDPFDTSQIKGISGYRMGPATCPTQDTRCSQTLTMVDAVSDMKRNVPSSLDPVVNNSSVSFNSTSNRSIGRSKSKFYTWYSSASQADKDAYWQTMARNQEILQGYQALPCKYQCSDRDLLYKNDNLKFVNGQSWTQFS